MDKMRWKVGHEQKSAWMLTNNELDVSFNGFQEENQILKFTCYRLRSSEQNVLVKGTPSTSLEHITQCNQKYEQTRGLWTMNWMEMTRKWDEK